MVLVGDLGAPEETWGERVELEDQYPKGSSKRP